MHRTFSGSNLRKARIDAGLPIERVALDVGRTADTIKNYEMGRIRPSANVLLDLATSVGVSMEDLYSVAS